mmetsp:Transcript_40863/g.94095  ORF Transcript_40863/g.94095 Transcript_40863/m.94095 type:complete len:89 (-) Transcript_40863:156-422(-)
MTWMLLRPCFSLTAVLYDHERAWPVARVRVDFWELLPAVSNLASSLLRFAALALAAFVYLQPFDRSLMGLVLVEFLCAAELSFHFDVT